MDYKKHESERLRNLAFQWMEAADSDLMKERKRLWKSLKDLKPVRPMIRLETCPIEGFIKDEELECQNAYLRNTERMLLLNVKHHDMIEDDIIIEPYFQLAWKVSGSGYGIDVKMRRAKDSLGLVFDSAINKPEDLDRLKEQTFYNDSENVLSLKQALEDIFGDILPIRMGNVEILTPEEIGFNPLVGINVPAISNSVIQLLGQKNMLLWAYDHPEALKRLIKHIHDDRLRYFKWMEKEHILDYNANGWNTSASSYGYCSDLPADGKDPAKTKDCWMWAESQESVAISPEMFAEYYLPYISDIASHFGLTYYGCCEPIQDRFHLIKKAIPNLRAVSISCWNDMYRAAEAVGDGYVFSRKPNPAPISGPEPQWDAARKDIEDTVNTAKDMPLEFIIRDVYDVNGDLDRLNKYVLVIREACNI
jgi:hypothetical protein